MTFPLSRDDWYAKRDDRTRRVSETESFENYKVGVMLSDNIADDFQCQVMLWLIANTLARWCRHITLKIPDQTISLLNYSKGENLKESLQSWLLKIDPYLDLKFDQIDDTLDGLCIIGDHDGITSSKSIWIDCDGWIAGVGLFPRKEYCRERTDRNILGASFAAFLGCAELFRRANNKSPQQAPEIWYSLFDFKRSSNKNELKNYSYRDDLEFGHIHQPGCGAVGSSFDYLLGLTDWRGSIDLIDFDAIDYSNCNRSLPFTAHNAVEGTNKVDVCLETLKGNPNIKCRRFLSDYSKYNADGNFFKPPPDLILCLANQGTIWSDIQQSLPPIVFHATTTPNWGINFGRHIPTKEWCILCRFSEEVKRLHNFIPPCGKGALVETSVEPIFGVLPFLSPSAAIVILAEMAKMSLPSYSDTANFLEFSLKTATGGFIFIEGQIKQDCTCRGQELDFYLEEIKRTKYWHFVDGSKK